jgi:alpha/beta superfamily hydrolase
MVSIARFSAKQHWDAAPKELKQKIRHQKIHSIILNIFTLGLYGLGALGINKLKRRLFTPQFMPAIKFPTPEMNKGIPFILETLDRVKLDARECILHPKSARWMIFFCGNGSPYQYQYKRVQDLANRLGWNLLLFNYRNVGHSKGKLTKSFQLQIDGSAAIEYLKHVGIQETNIVLYGYSLGGAVSAELGKYYRKCKWINDFSFASLAMVAAKKVNGILGLLTHLLGYQLNPLKAWMKINPLQKCYFYHAQDTLITRHLSLHYCIKQKLMKSEPQCRIAKRSKKFSNRKKAHGLMPAYKPYGRVKIKTVNPLLTQQGIPDNHGLLFSAYPHEFQKVLAAVGRLFPA